MFLTQDSNTSRSSPSASHLLHRAISTEDDFLCPPAAIPTPTPLAPPLFLLHGGGQSEGFSTAPVRSCKLPLQRERGGSSHIPLHRRGGVVVLWQCVSACGQLLLHPSPSELFCDCNLLLPSCGSLPKLQ